MSLKQSPKTRAPGRQSAKARSRPGARAGRLRHPGRGYILLEVVLGGAMAAVIIAGVLTTVSHARTKNVHAARDVTASQLVLERLEERRALGYGAVAVLSESPVAGVVGRYERTTSVATCVETIAAPGANTNCKDVTVTVSYRTTDLGAGTIRRSQATARVYQ